MSDHFIPFNADVGEATGTLPDSASPAKRFELEELTPGHSTSKPGFSFDNEIQRNFDPSNVSKAKEGVKEVFEDAMHRIKMQAQNLKKEAHKEGFDTGYQEGFKAGEEAAKVEFAPFLQTLQTLVHDLSEFRTKMYPKVEREMVEMIVGLTQKIVTFELAQKEDSVKDVIRLAVQSTLDRETMTIKVNPADKMYAETYRHELHQLFGEIKNITFEAQPAITRGGCIVESNFGVVDAQIEGLQNQIEKILQLAPAPVEGMGEDAPAVEETPAEDTEENQPTEPLPEE